MSHLRGGDPLAKLAHCDVRLDGEYTVLPQEHAYDIVFRHALDVDDRGERLAFGSTTGSVWISDADQRPVPGIRVTLDPDGRE